MEPGIIQGEKMVIRAVTIAMRQTLDRHGVSEQVKRTFGCVLFDEIQGAPANTAYRILDSFPARYRIGVSADERRVDHKESLTYDLLGKAAADIPSAALLAEKVIMPVDLVAVPTDFRAEWKSAEASFLEDSRTGDLARDYKRLCDELVVDAARNDQIVDIVLREIRAGEQVLVLTTRVQHALTLRKQIVDAGFLCGLLVGEYPKERPATEAGLLDGSLRVAVGTVKASGTGLNFPWLSVGVLALPIGKENSYQLGQTKGRFCRAPAGKTSAKLYAMVDLAVFGTEVLRRLARWQRASGIGGMFVLDRSDGDLLSVEEFIRRSRSGRRR